MSSKKALLMLPARFLMIVKALILFSRAVVFMVIYLSISLALEASDFDIQGSHAITFSSLGSQVSILNLKINVSGYIYIYEQGWHYQRKKLLKFILGTSS
jgi:hypothetical protein